MLMLSAFLVRERLLRVVGGVVGGGRSAGVRGMGRFRLFLEGGELLVVLADPDLPFVLFLNFFHYYLNINTINSY